VKDTQRLASSPGFKLSTLPPPVTELSLPPTQGDRRGAASSEQRHTHRRVLKRTQQTIRRTSRYLISGSYFGPPTTLPRAAGVPQEIVVVKVHETHIKRGGVSVVPTVLQVC
jgi:hypothetical protein